jgi:hypothetical protein
MLVEVAVALVLAERACFDYASSTCEHGGRART